METLGSFLPSIHSRPGTSSSQATSSKDDMKRASSQASTVSKTRSRISAITRTSTSSRCSSVASYHAPTAESGMILREACISGDIPRALELLKNGHPLSIKILEDACQIGPDSRLPQLYRFVTGKRRTETIHMMACRRVMPCLAVHTFAGRTSDKVNELIISKMDDDTWFPLVLKLAIRKDASTKNRNKAGETVFNMACRNQSLIAVKLLSETNKVNLFTPDFHMNVPLHHVCGPKEFELASLIIQRGKLKKDLFAKMINARNTSGDNILAKATSQNNVKLVKLLVKNGVALDSPMSTTNPESVLGWAIGKGFPLLTLFLLRHNAPFGEQEYSSAVIRRSNTRENNEFKRKLLEAFNKLPPSEQNNLLILELLIALEMFDPVGTVLSRWEQAPEEHSAIFCQALKKPAIAEQIVSLYDMDKLRRDLSSIHAKALPFHIQMILLPTFDPNYIYSLITSISADIKNKVLNQTIQLHEGETTTETTYNDLLQLINTRFITSFLNPNMQDNSEYYSEQIRVYLRFIPPLVLASAVHMWQEFFIPFMPHLDTSQVLVATPLLRNDCFLSFMGTLPLNLHKHYLKAATDAQRRNYIEKPLNLTFLAFQNLENRLIEKKYAFDRWKDKNKIGSRTDFALSTDQQRFCREYGAELQNLQSSFAQQKDRYEIAITAITALLESSSDIPPLPITKWETLQLNRLGLIEKMLKKMLSDFDLYARLLPIDTVSHDLVTHIEEPPTHFLDPYTTDIMTDPVSDQCKPTPCVFDRSTVTKIWRSDMKTTRCPTTTLPIDLSSLKSESGLKSEIETYRTRSLGAGVGSTASVALSERKTEA